MQVLYKAGTTSTMSKDLPSTPDPCTACTVLHSMAPALPPKTQADARNNNDQPRSVLQNMGKGARI
jgi:hypothetical protein